MHIPQFYFQREQRSTCLPIWLIFFFFVYWIFFFGCIMAEVVLKLGTPTEEDETSVSVIRISNETKTKPKRSTTTIKDLESKMADMEKRVDDKFDRLLSSIVFER